MKRILRGLGIALLVLLAAIAATGLFARFQDGPVAMFPGGPLTSGEWADPSWQDAAFLSEVGSIELQLLEPARSRTVWVLVHEGIAYVPCGLPTLGKQWPHQVMADGRVVVRVEGQRHRRTAVRVTDPAVRARLGEIVAAKYGTPSVDPEDADSVWFFRLDPRS